MNDDKLVETSGIDAGIDSWKADQGGWSWLVALSQPPFYRSSRFSKDGRVNRIGEKGKAECMDSKKSTYSRCTQAQKQWEAAHPAKAYLYSFKYAMGSSRNISNGISSTVPKVIDGDGQLALQRQHAEMLVQPSSGCARLQIVLQEEEKQLQTDSKVS